MSCTAESNRVTNFKMERRALSMDITVVRALGCARTNSRLEYVLAYMVVLLSVLVFVEEESKWAPLFILLPVVPLFWVAVAVYRSYQRSDEYHRLVQAESMALSFGVAMIGSIAFGFLGIAEAVHPAVGPWVVFGLAMTTWLIGVGVRWIQ